MKEQEVEFYRKCDNEDGKEVEDQCYKNVMMEMAGVGR